MRLRSALSFARLKGELIRPKYCTTSLKGKLRGHFCQSEEAARGSAHLQMRVRRDRSRLRGFRTFVDVVRYMHARCHGRSEQDFSESWYARSWLVNDGAEMTTFVPGPTVTIPLADYKQLVGLIEHDDMFVVCSTCGAWLHRDDPATCSVDDFDGCWKVAGGRPTDDKLCRSYRATVCEQPTDPKMTIPNIPRGVLDD